MREASNSEQLSAWQEKLIVFLKDSGKWQNVHVPSKFPGAEIVKLYTKPNVSTAKRLEKWKDPAICERAIGEELLWPFPKTHFSIRGRGYDGHVVPILLTQALMQPTPNNRILRCKPSIEKCDEEANGATVITLLLSEITSLDVTSLGTDKATKGQDYHAEYKERRSVPKWILRLGYLSIVEEFEYHQAKVKLKLTKEKGQQRLSFSKAAESEEQQNSPTALPKFNSIHPASTIAKQTPTPLIKKKYSTKNSPRVGPNTADKRVLGGASSSIMNKRRRIEIPTGCQPINQGPLSTSKVLAGSQTNLKIPLSSTPMMSSQCSGGDEIFS
ncbi:hypothetical protein ACEPPN_008464 [Leptodophora sp. 'Broadleaf-Isolate-01']